jgi:DNA-binding phage protein
VVKRVVGRPVKVDYKVMMKLADALQHSATVSDACRYAGISRDTYYRHLNNEPTFKEKMEIAKANQYRLVSFMTLL